MAERRLVSVLFADLVGFTPFAEERDSEEVRETLTRYFDLSSEVIARYGGRVEKFIGDAVMAVWGAPVAREDDPERAVRAAMELLDVVRQLGPGIQARAGVLTGEAAVTLNATNQGMVAGDLVNTAARLQSVAEPGAVLVGETTMHAASASIVFEPAGAQSLKGKAEGVPAWRAVRVVAERGGRGRSDVLEAPFVGRDDDFRLLKELFHATGRERRIRLVSIMGPAGIGKSRLGWEFSKYADGVAEAVWWHVGRSPSYGDGISFWALGEMVRRRAGLAADADEATTRTKIAATVAEHIRDETERGWIEPALLTLLGIGGDPRGSEQLFSAWRTFFERLAENGTVALVFEDLHWADTGTLDFIDHLMDWSRNSPIFIVTQARPELLDRKADWGAGKRHFTSLYLEPLPDTAMRSLLSGLVPGLPESAVQAILARADGIPLYAVETVRTLIAEGRIRLDGDRYVPSGDLTAFAVPETLHALIAARLDALPSGDRTLVTLASVLGQSFTLAGLAALTGTSEAELAASIEDLERRELLVNVSDPRSPERGQYAFVQGLIREVAYGTLARRDRKTHHLAAARHFESLQVDEMSGALAVHYLAAYQHATEGAEADALAGQARIALKAAAARATTLGSHAQAGSFLQQALTLTDDPGERAELLEQAGGAALRAGRHQEAATLVEQAVDLHRQRADGTSVARSLAQLGWVLLHTQQASRALGILLPAAVEFADLSNREVAALHGQLARAHIFHNDAVAALETAERVLHVAENMDFVEVVADTLTTKALALTRLGRMHEGVGVLSAGRELARAKGLAQAELRATINHGVLSIDSNPAAALEASRSGHALAQRMGIRHHLLVANIAETSIPTGAWDAAQTILDESLASDPEGLDLVMLLSVRANLLAARGVLEPGEVDELDRMVAESDDEAWTKTWAEAKPGVDLYLGNLVEAREAAERQAPVDRNNAGMLLGVAGRAAMWARDVESLERIIGDARRLVLRGRYREAQERHMLAGLDALQGRRSHALEGFRHALSEYAEVGARFDQAMVGITMLATLGPADPAARAEGERARTTFQELGARPLLERLDALLAQSSVVDAAGSAAGEEAMTASP